MTPKQTPHRYTSSQGNKFEEPPLAPGMVRYYHGSASGTEAGDWLTPHRDYAQGYADKGGSQGRIYYVDIPKDKPPEYAYDEINNYWINFQAPPEIARQLKLLVTPDAEKANALRQEAQALPPEVRDAKPPAMETTEDFWAARGMAPPNPAEFEMQTPEEGEASLTVPYGQGQLDSPSSAVPPTENPVATPAPPVATPAPPVATPAPPVATPPAEPHRRPWTPPNESDEPARLSERGEDIEEVFGPEPGAPPPGPSPPPAPLSEPPPRTSPRPPGRLPPLMQAPGGLPTGPAPRGLGDYAPGDRSSPPPLGVPDWPQMPPVAEELGDVVSSGQAGGGRGGVGGFGGEGSTDLLEAIEDLTEQVKRLADILGREQKGQAGPLEPAGMAEPHRGGGRFEPEERPRARPQGSPSLPNPNGRW